MVKYDKLARYYNPASYSSTGVRYRATSVAKKDRVLPTHLTMQGEQSIQMGIQCSSNLVTGVLSR